ncbi:amino acid ABC transporter permease [Alkalilimnicola sp. S0819]|uniref:amino acid ABC transporter permease n=1 Tax=Alkalilimnicola sp. S0819 TaxID=2613922 RepID=UPI001D0186DD|nr:amino acid ABC transporter permease [Alkalilimnicola sp. S0819]
MNAAWRWSRENLFSSPLNTALTVLSVALLGYMVPPLLDWALFSADFRGNTREACEGEGACWVFVRVHLPQFIYGFYPEELRWRVNLAFLLLPLWAAPLFWRRMSRKGWWLASLLLLYPLCAWTLFRGGVAGLAPVPTSDWGGLFLTLVIAGVGMAAALPLGVLLALGRRSRMPITRAICTVFIEFWRGVPLITVLFMASVMLPLFLPQGVNLDKLLRALIGVALFAGAYMAEVIRGGLQGVDRGQYEAAEALGLGYWRQMGLIILPQALRLVIPGIVNSFIALFKDTTLVLIIGLFDLLGIVQAAATDPRWLGSATEGYVFAGLLFWVFCYGMSLYSRRLERRPGAGR